MTAGLVGRGSLIAIAQQRGVEAALQLLVGERLCIIGRSSTLLWLHFGDKRRSPTRRNLDRITGEFAVHTEAPWRITGPDGIITGSIDIWHPEEGADIRPGSPPSPSRFDTRVESLRVLADAGGLMVDGVSVDGVGTLRITLSDRYRFEVFPVESIATEQWRLFRPGTDDSHVVVSQYGLELDEADL